MLSICVSWSKSTMTDIEGLVMREYPAFTEQNGQLIHIEYCETFPDLEDVEIILTRGFLPFLFIRLKLPEKLKAAIITFFRCCQGKVDPSFDCYSFACMVHGVDASSGSSFLWRFWKRVPWWRRRSIGDTVLFLDQDKKLFRHAALYLGLGVYLGVRGSGGNLQFATLRDMKKDQRADSAVFVSPA